MGRTINFLALIKNEDSHYRWSASSSDYGFLDETGFGRDARSLRYAIDQIIGSALKEVRECAAWARQSKSPEPTIGTIELMYRKSKISISPDADAEEAAKKLLA